MGASNAQKPVKIEGTNKHRYDPSVIGVPAGACPPQNPEKVSA